MLNLLRYDAEQQPMACIGKDRPIWERDDLPNPGEKVPIGYLEYLTWRSRHIRLLPEREGAEIVVRRLYIAQAESFPSDYQIREQDPMFAYREAKDGGLLPLKLQADRALWRDSASLFEYGASGKKGQRRRPAAFGQLAELMHQGKLEIRAVFRCFVVGLVNAQANPLLWRMEEMSPPVTLLEDRSQVRFLKEALQRAETVSERLRYSTRVLAEALLTLNRRSADKKDLEKIENTLRTGPDYWAALEAPFFRFLHNPSEAAERQWTTTLFRAARDAMQRSAVQYVASSARDLQAQVKGMACLNATLKKLEEEFYPDEEKEVSP
jgi:CRISPR system Cascade subunit CasA